jgi:hypothetical protein
MLSTIQFGLVGLALMAQVNTAVVVPTSGTILPEPSVEELIVEISEEQGIRTKVALAIAECESTKRQFNDKGEILRGRENDQDVGVFQINEKYHLEKSRSLGYDIYSTEGNILYAMYLLDTQGRAPWVHSKPCWSQKIG